MFHQPEKRKNKRPEAFQVHHNGGHVSLYQNLLNTTASSASQGMLLLRLTIATLNT
jgi:hypothetical protein